MVLQNAARRRGPRTELSDPQLWSRRDQLIQYFGGAWGRIGWTLPRCKKPEDFIPILTPLAEGYIRDFIAVFCRPAQKTVSGTELRKLRRELRRVTKQWLDLYETKRHSVERLQSADQAFAGAKDNRRLLKRARKKYRKETARVVAPWRALSARRESLEQQLRDSEASFARKELLRFLKSKRYEITPESLANAAAGLPYMGWRQSMRRNKKKRSIIAIEFSYEIFKAIRYLVGTARNKSERALLNHFRAGVPTLPGRYKLPMEELAKHWFYLERAILRCCRSRPHPKSLPFEITAGYFDQFRCQSQADVVLAGQARLPLRGTSTLHSS